MPLTHAESETPVSAMLSGVVVKAGVFPLVRCALLVPSLAPVVELFGVTTAIWGVGYGVFEQDTKRLLAFSTISQLGFVMAAPVVAGFYALTHGLVKAALFLTAGQLPSRSFKELQTMAIATPYWFVFVAAGCSISGLPLFAGFGSKILVTKNLYSWQEIAMNIAAVGTAICFAKFIFLPHKLPQKFQFKAGFWLAIVVLLGGLAAANGFYPEAYQLSNALKALLITGLGWLIYLMIFKRITLKLPRMLEQFEQLIGVMSVVLTGLFWMVLA